MRDNFLGLTLVVSYVVHGDIVSILSKTDRNCLSAIAGVSGELREDIAETDIPRAEPVTIAVLCSCGLLAKQREYAEATEETLEKAENLLEAPSSVLGMIRADMIF